MLLFLSSLAASLDGLIMGIGLRFSKVHISFQKFMFIFLGNLIIYGFVLILYSAFHFTFITKSISTIFYLVLALHALFSEEKLLDQPLSKDIGYLECVFLTLTHSMDGTLISLAFVYEYPIFIIVLLFSFVSVIILCLGYQITKKLPFVKKSNFISAFLFLCLAISNQFF